MEAKNVFDAAALVAAAGGALFVLVNIIRMGFHDMTPRQSVIVALVGGGVLVLLYAASNNLLTMANSFNIALAWISVTAAGAGLNSTANAARTGQGGS